MNNNPIYASDNFMWREFYCPLLKSVPVSDLTLHHIGKLEELRVRFDGPLRVNSGYRSPEHNNRVGGAPNSMHLEFASDLTPVRSANMDQLDRLAELAEAVGFSGIGRYNTFLPLDCRAVSGRGQGRWDNRSAP